MDENEDQGWYSDKTATFGDRVAAARETVGLTQKDLARRLGVKHKTLAAWEDDLSEPRANKLQMLSGILNVSMRWLLTGQGAGLSEPRQGMELSSDTAEILAELRETRGQATLLAEKVGRLEKRLRHILKEPT